MLVFVEGEKAGAQCMSFALVLCAMSFALQCMSSSYGAPRVKPYFHFFWNYETLPAWGRTGDALTFHGEYWTPSNTPTNRADHQYRDIMTVRFGWITSRAIGHHEKFRAGGFARCAAQLGSQQPPIRE